jgi:hypothetical protein
MLFHQSMLGPVSPAELNVHMFPDTGCGGGFWQQSSEEQFAPPGRQLGKVCGILEEQGGPKGRACAHQLEQVVYRIYDLLNERAPDVDRVDFAAELKWQISRFVDVQAACYKLGLGEEAECQLPHCFEEIGIRFSEAFIY